MHNGFNIWHNIPSWCFEHESYFMPIIAVILYSFLPKLRNCANYTFNYIDDLLSSTYNPFTNLQVYMFHGYHFSPYPFHDGLRSHIRTRIASLESAVRNHRTNIDGIYNLVRDYINRNNIPTNILEIFNQVRLNQIRLSRSNLIEYPNDPDLIQEVHTINRMYWDIERQIIEISDTVGHILFLQDILGDNSLFDYNNFLTTTIGPLLAHRSTIFSLSNLNRFRNEVTAVRTRYRNSNDNSIAKYRNDPNNLP